MHKYSWLIQFPKLYAFLFSRQKFINHEKLLYLNTIKKGDVVFDIGANIGYFTMLFSKLCGKCGEVHSFEPIPATFHKLLYSVESFGNVRTINKAVGDYIGLVDMHYNPNESEKASLIKPMNFEFEKVQVPLISLDTYFKKNDLECLDFVKCDVEGFEFNALKGFEKTLMKYKPKLSIEVTITGNERAIFFDFLQDLGYKLFKKIESGFPEVDPNDLSNLDKDFFYLYATC